MDEKEKKLIEQIYSRVDLLLKGKMAEPLSVSDCPQDLKNLVLAINELIYSFSEIWDFILPLSQGMLNIEPPKSRNLLASPFKELHSQLKTLVWQVQRIAQGDYKQRVVFMGEFSQAFNSLVEALEEKSRLVEEHIEFLEKEAEKLRAGQLRYASAVKNSPGGIYIFDPSTLQIIETNEKFNEMMGYTKEDILGLTVYDLYSDRTMAQEDLDHILGKSLHSITNRSYRLKNGGCICVDLYSCWAITGKSSVVIISVQDVTERNKAQEIAAKYKVLLENARDIILFVCLDGRIIEANKAAEESYGYDRKQLLSLNFFDLCSPDDRSSIKRQLKETDFKGITYETIHIRKDGSSFPVEVSSQGVMVAGNGNEVVLGKVIRDISERKKIEERLLYFATHDNLTKIPNRYSLEKTYYQIIADHKIEGKNTTGTLLLIDVDNFKNINDMFGHSVGDLVLVDLVSILQANLSKEAILARWGGDEFAILLDGADLEEGRLVAEKLRQAVEKTKLCPSDGIIPFGYSISIGVTPIPNGDLKFEEVISHADYALYQAKEQGGNMVSCTTYEQLEMDIISQVNNLRILITKALQENRLVLYFQPVVDIFSGEIIHHEALMRIIDEKGEIVFPGKTILVAERFGLMPQIDRQVVRAAFQALEKYPKLNLFVNLSGSSIGDEDLLNLIEENLEKSGVEPSRLGFEITETTAVKNLVRAEKWVKRLKERGCKFALDDFGMGFSSFSYLLYLSVDYVKIDGSYIKDIDKNKRSRALVQGMNTVATSLGIEVVAECVENRAILEVLKEDLLINAQGYYLGTPEISPNFEIQHL